ncbi:MAG: hypothetical protein WCG27_06730 [Pseudomonadota bacterium]
MGSKLSEQTSPLNNEYLEQYQSVIIDAVLRDKPLNSERFSTAHIFQAIFEELVSSYRQGTKSALTLGPLPVQLVLIPGVLNEIFDKVAFEKGAEILSQKFGINYLPVRVRGIRGPDYNSKTIFAFLKAHIKKNPDATFWLVGHSKGSIDCLHFLSRHPRFARKYIKGLTTIAAPICGSKRPGHLLLRMLNYVYQWPLDLIIGDNLKKLDCYAHEVQEALSIPFRQKWFKKNACKLPQNIFYTSLALESNFFEGATSMKITKLLFPSKAKNDGIVDVDEAHFPPNFKHYNLGTVRGDHLIGQDESAVEQEALLAAHVILLKYLGHL